MAATAQTTIIKRVVEDGGDGHHGGAWKVAYADFMTAMMAFFLLLWILSSSDEQKLRGIAEYFTDATKPGGLGVLDGASLGPPGTLTASNGAILARGSELGKEDQSVTAKWEVRDVTPTSDPQETAPGSTEGLFENPAGGAASQAFNSETSLDETGERAGAGDTDKADDDAASQNTIGQNDNTHDGTGGKNHDADEQRFDILQSDLMQAMQANPDLRPLMENVVFERTPKGMRIQVIDQEGKPMFASGNAEMLPATRALMSKLGQSLTELPNQMVITGHTDSVPFSGRANYDNWDLSTDRANATRRVLLNAGVERGRLLSVTGKAYTDPLVAEHPDDPSNRRITVFLQYSDETAAEPQAEPTATTPMKKAGAAPAADATPNSDTAMDAQGSEIHEEVSKDANHFDDDLLENLRSVLR